MKRVVLILVLFLVVSPIAAGAASSSAGDPGAPTGPEPDAASAEPAAAEYPSLDSLTDRHQPYLENISAYKPMYFLVGTDPEDSKFQFSFKYRLFNSQSAAVSELPLLAGIHFAFTQTSFWDLAGDSKPFQDTGYKPEIFFISPNMGAGFQRLKGFFIQTGLEHESNGRPDDESRSTNFLYLTPTLIFYDEARQSGLALATKLWVYVDNDEETNPDLEEYRGYFEATCKLGREAGLVLASSFRWAEKGTSVQLDLTYPLNRLFANILDIYLHVQYFNGFAESLLDYRERTEALRVGLAVIR